MSPLPESSFTSWSTKSTPRIDAVPHHQSLVGSFQAQPTHKTNPQLFASAVIKGSQPGVRIRALLQPLLALVYWQALPSLRRPSRPHACPGGCRCETRFLADVGRSGCVHPDQLSIHTARPESNHGGLSTPHAYSDDGAHCSRRPQARRGAPAAFEKSLPLLRRFLGSICCFSFRQWCPGSNDNSRNTVRRSPKIGLAQYKRRGDVLLDRQLVATRQKHGTPQGKWPHVFFGS